MPTYSSNPSSTLYPWLNPEIPPNYNNALDWHINNMQSWQDSPIPKYSDYVINPEANSNTVDFQVGLVTSKSDNPETALKGKTSLQDSVKDLSKDFSTLGSAVASKLYPKIAPTKGKFAQKFNNSTFGKNYDLWNASLNIANTVFTSIAGEKDEYSGEKGNVTRTMDSTYDTIQNFAGAIPVYGQVLSLAMGANKLLGNVANKLGAGTDGMCVCAGTKVFKANGEEVNIENLKQEDGIIGWNSNTRKIEPQTIKHLITPRQKKCIELIFDTGQILRCSIDHPIYSINEHFIPAVELKIGDIVLSSTLDSKVYKSTVISIKPIGIQTVYNLQADNNHTYLANGIITHNTTTDAILGSSLLQLTPFGLINGFGGKKARTLTKDDQAFATVGSSYTGTNQTVNDALAKSGKKYGLFSRDALSDANNEILEAIRQQTTMSNIADDATERFNIRNSMSAINGNRRRYYLQGGTNWANVRMGRSGMSLELIAKAKKILSEPKKLQNGGTIKDPFEYYMSTLPVAQRDSSKKKDTPSHKEGGQIQVKPTQIVLVEPELIESSIDAFKEGGSINVIPDGALHARKHNMDMEGITEKGIPVVAENKDGNVEQQAEIEKEEIIFRLEVTKKLEELEKKFYDEETSKEEKDQLALEAGKLLVEEILYNTQDNTNKLL